MGDQSGLKKATFALGCFWCPEPAFGVTKGVIFTRVGYAGGTKPNPTYRDLGDHTESLDVDYDPEHVKYTDLLNIFWENHDATVNRKRQYMSTIFYHDDEQKSLAETSIENEKRKSMRPIHTELKKAGAFYEAEDYHQKYRLQQERPLMKLLGIAPSQLIRSHLCARLNGYVAGYGKLTQFEEEVPKLGLTKPQADYVRQLLKSGNGPVCH